MPSTPSPRSQVSILTFSIPLAGKSLRFIVAVPAMALLFRLRAAYLSIGTWVVAEVLMLSAAGKIEAFGGGSGISDAGIEILRAFPA